jgi:hypothetical protein
MMDAQPVQFVWRQVDMIDGDGEAHRAKAMVPAPKYKRIAEKQYAENASYVLSEVEERNMRFHDLYFATLHEYFVNIPEKIQARWTSEKHFRQFCLCETGHYHEKEFDLQTADQAKRFAKFCRREEADYMQISVHDKKVIARWAKSQAVKAMGAEEFKASVDAVLDLAAQFVGVAPGKMVRESLRHA